MNLENRHLRTASRMSLTRRAFLRAGAAGLVGLAAPGLALAARGVTDLEGFDSLWRSAEEVIAANFAPGTEFQTGGLHLDVPQHVDTGSSVPVTIRLDSAMTDQDCPVVIHLVAHGNPTPQILSLWLDPRAGRGEVSTRIRLEQSQRVTAVAAMRDGRHLRADRDVQVSFGACAQVGSGSNDDVFGFRPETRISVPPVARMGEVVTLRAVISHPMETGLRKSATDEWVRQRIVSTFRCVQGGREVLAARLYPAMASNPYFMFHLRAEVSGPVQFRWFDMTGPTYTAEAPFAVLNGA
jgi:sulfur-oxidizing protein SoxY